MQTDAIRRITIESKVVGADESTQKLGDLRKSQDAVASSVDGATQKISAYEQALQRQQRVAEMSFRQNQQFGNSLRLIADNTAGLNRQMEALNQTSKITADNSEKWSFAAKLLLAVAAVTVGVGLLTAAFVVLYEIVKYVPSKVAEAWELGRAKLQEYIDLNQRAGNNSTDFYQRLIKGATDAKIPVDLLLTSLKSLGDSLAPKFGGSAGQNKIDELSKFGNFKGNTGVAELRLAVGDEERLKALASFYKQAQAANQELAAQEVIRATAGDAMSKALAKDSLLLEDLKTKMQAVKQDELIKQADVDRAAGLKVQMEAALKTISDIQTKNAGEKTLMTSIGVEMNALWVSIVSLYARALQGMDNLYDSIVRVFQLKPSSDWTDFWKNFNRASVEGFESGINADSKDIAMGAARTKLASQLQNPLNVARSTANTQEIADKLNGDVSSTGAYAKATEEVKKYIEQTRLETIAVGQSVGEAERAKVIAQLYAAALNDGLSPALALARAQSDDLTKAAGNVADALDRANKAKAAQDAYKAGVDSVKEYIEQTKLEIQFHGQAAGKLKEAEVNAQLYALALKQGLTPEQARATVSATGLGAAAGELATKLETLNKKNSESRDQYDRAKDTIEKHTARLIADTAAIGLGVGAQEEFRAKAALVTAAKQAELEITPKLTAEYDKLAKAAGIAGQARAEEAAKNKAAFDLQTIFLSDTEKQIASVNFQLHGNAWKDFMNDGLSSTLRVVDALKLVKDAAGTFASGLAKDLASGVPAVEALQSALKTLASSVLDAAVKRLVDQALGGLASALTGAAGGAVAGASQAATMTTGATTAAGILTSAGATVGASIIAGATEAAGILGLSVPAAASTLPVAGTVAGTEIAAGSVAGGAALVAGGAAVETAAFTLSAAMGPIALAMAALAAVAAIIGLSGGQSKADKWLQDQTEGMNQRSADYANRAALIGVDPNTRQGAILAQDQKFNQERLAENKAGGQRMNQLLQLEVQERNQLLADWDKKETDQLKANADAKLAIEKAANDRALGFQNRLFAATNDFTTLEGKLAAFDHTAAQDRAKEVDDGGQAIVALETAQAAERLKVIKDSEDAKLAIEQATQDRALGFQNRLFAAANDNSTLEGQLAAFDRAAQQERVTEVRNGGQDIIDLEAAQAADRFNVIRDYNKKIVADAEATAKAQQDAFNSAAKNIVDYVKGLSAGPNSTDSPQNVFNAAQAAYLAKLALAQSGNVDAQSTITQDAENYRLAARALYASGAGYQDILLAIKSQLLALPAVQTTTDPVVAAMRDVLAAINAGNAAQALDATLQGVIKSAIDAGNASAVASALLAGGKIPADGLNFTDFVKGLGPSYAAVATDSKVGSLLTDTQLRAAGINVSGPLTNAQITQLGLSKEEGNVLNVWRELDGNGNGILEISEATKAASQATNVNAGGIASNTNIALTKMDGAYSAIDATRVGVGTTANNVNSVKGAVDQDRNTLEYSNTIFNALVGLQTTATSQLTLLTAALKPSVVSVSITGSGNTTPGSSPGVPLTLNNQVVDSLNKIVWNTYVIAQNTEYKADGSLAHGHAGGGTFAMGGWITGGIPGRDSVHILAQQEEFMVNRNATRALTQQFGAGVMDMINMGRLPFNDNGRPLNVVAPLFRGGGGDNGNAALLAEVKALREEVAQLRKENNAGLDRQTRMTGAIGEHIREGVDELTDSHQELVRETKFKQAS